MQTLRPIELSVGNIRFKDHVHWVFYGNGVWKCAFIAFILIFLMLVGVHITSGHPVSVQVFLAAIYPSFVAFIMILLWTFLLTSFQFKRLSSDQRSVSWKFSNVGFTFSDKAGNEIKKPWSEIRAVKFSKLGARIYSRPFGSFWIPERWFPKDTIFELKNLIEDKGL